MKTIIRNPYIRWTVRIALIILCIVLIAAFSFFQGMFYANRRAEISITSTGLFHSWLALEALRNTEPGSYVRFIDRKMDLLGSQLADMSIKYPTLIERQHYNLLVWVRKYWMQYGHGSNDDFADINKKIAVAVKHLESIHDTNDWTESSNGKL